MIEPINGKYLTDEDCESYQDYMGALYNTNEDTASISVTFILTESCNLNCSYCYLVNKSNKRMDKSTAKQAVDFLFDKELINGYYDLETVKAINIEFIGGEPLLELELMNYITEYFKYRAYKNNNSWKYNYRFSATSNGVNYFNKDFQNYFNKNYENFSLSITVDGNKNLHDSCRLFSDGTGSYDIASSALKDLARRNDRASTKLTLCPENVHYLKKAVQSLYEDLGVHFIYANCVYEEGWKNHHAIILYDQMRQLSDWIIDNEIYDNLYCSLYSENLGQKCCDSDKNWCGGTGKMLAIGTNGDCYPCVRFAPHSLSNQKPIVLGNIYDGILINQSQCQMCNHLKSITIATQSNSKCLKCEVSEGCSLCSGYNYDKFGDANMRATYICDMHKARVRANKYYWSKLRGKINGMYRL